MRCSGKRNYRPEPATAPSYNRAMGKFFHRRRHCLSVWIACFAILLNALAPSISHAFTAAQGQPPALIEICSVAGTRYIAPGADANVSAPVDKNHVAEAAAHCPFCQTHAGSDALPPPLMPDFHPAALQGTMPRLFYQAPQPLFSWSAAKPRGPPAVS